MSWSMLKSGSFNSMLKTISLSVQVVLVSLERSVISTGHLAFILSDIYCNDMFWARQVVVAAIIIVIAQTKLFNGVVIV